MRGNGGRFNLTKNKTKRSLALIPCYNEEITIGSIVHKTRRYVDEVLVIDDGSEDGTAKIAKEAGATVLIHDINKGKGAGIKDGFSYALSKKYDYVVTLDGDAQHNPDEIPVLLNSIKNNGHDITLGVRYGENTEMPLWRKMGKRVLDYATSMGNGGFVTDSQCGFRAFNNKAVENLVTTLKGNQFSVESEELIKAHDAGLNIASERVSCKYKDLDTSTKTPTSHGFTVIKEILWFIFGKKPLLFIAIPGFIMTILGLLLGIYTINIYDHTHIFNLAYAIMTAFFLIIGAIALTVGLFLNVLPNMIRRSAR